MRLLLKHPGSAFLQIHTDIWGLRISDLCSDEWKTVTPLVNFEDITCWDDVLPSTHYLLVTLSGSSSINKGGPPLDPPLLITCSPPLSNATFLSFSFLEPRQRSPLLTSFKEIIMLLEIFLAFNRRLLFTSILWQDCLHSCKNYLTLLKFQLAKFFKIAVFFPVFNCQSMFLLIIDTLNSASRILQCRWLREN